MQMLIWIESRPLVVTTGPALCFVHNYWAAIWQTNRRGLSISLQCLMISPRDVNVGPGPAGMAYSTLSASIVLTNSGHRYGVWPLTKGFNTSVCSCITVANDRGERVQWRPTIADTICSDIFYLTITWWRT